MEKVLDLFEITKNDYSDDPFGKCVAASDGLVRAITQVDELNSQFRAKMVRYYLFC